MCMPGVYAHICTMHCRLKKLNDEGKMAANWINIIIGLFIMSIKVRQMINKTIWKVCNDLNGLGQL